MKAVSLLSGGIDSPVASILMAERGVEIVLVHFHNHTIQKHNVENKVERLADGISLQTKNTVKLYLVPFKEVQDAIIQSTPAEYRMIVNRRAMFYLAEEIRKKEKAEAFVTGDNLGQVASQTLPNMLLLHKTVNVPVLTPLLGMDKKEIVEMAKKYETYELSVLPYSDCCSYLVAKHPKTKAEEEKILEFEAGIKFNELVPKIVEEAKVMEFGRIPTAAEAVSE